MHNLYDAENALIGAFVGINFWHTPKYVITYYLFIYCCLFSHRMQLYFLATIFYAFVWIVPFPNYNYFVELFG